MSPTYPVQSLETWSPTHHMTERSSPTEGVIMSSLSQDNLNSPVPVVSITSYSSPGSTSNIRNVLSESASTNSFQIKPTSFPSTSSFYIASTFQRVNSTLSLCSETNPNSSVVAGSTSPTLSPVVVTSNNDVPMTSGKSPSASAKKAPKAGVNRRRSSVSKGRPKSTGELGEDTNANRRQKRLQRNRESARLSRRRRKVYLEELEERLNKLSDELDKGRRVHASKAIESIKQKRNIALSKDFSHMKTQVLKSLEENLSLTSYEMMVYATFQSVQLKSFFVPPSTKFIMWMTLQSDSYFRGGRAASERLSAARIGERMLTSGTDRATPSQRMWPLLCNEIGVSYDQEEKVRTFQKGLLLDRESWVDRHGVFASEKVLTTLHDATQALILRIGQREKSTLSILSENQKYNFLSWANKNKSRLGQLVSSKVRHLSASHQFKTSCDQHTASNLYIVNNQLEKIIQVVPRAAPMITGEVLKKLYVRPSFESLSAQDEKFPYCPIAREESFASTGSLTKDEAEMKVDLEDKVPTQITPQEAQALAKSRLDEALGHVKCIMPVPPTPYSFPLINVSFASTTIPCNAISEPLVYSDTSLNTSNDVLSFPPSVTVSDQSMSMSFPNQESSHQRKSSFLPAHLNVVPEMMWTDDTDEILMDLVDSDWAIGEGIDMDQLS